MKKAINLKKKLREVTNTFLNDFAFANYTRYDSNLLDNVLQESLQPQPVLLQAGDIFLSSGETSRLRHFKYQVSALNTRLEKVKESSLYLNEYCKHIVKSQGDLLRKIDSEVESLEVKYFENSDIVHVNNFSKESDKIDYTKNSTFKKDYKTNLTFQKKNLMEGIFGSGLGLPLDSKDICNVDRCIVIDEETNVGDSVKKIFDNENPNNIFRKNKIFRYAIVKRTSDTSSRFYKRKTSFVEYPYSLAPTLTLEVDLESYSSINYLKIDPVSVQGFSLKNIQIKNGNSVIDLNFELKIIDNKFYIFFETIYSNKLKLKFEQKAFIENAKVIISGKKNFYLNESLQKNGYLSRVEEEYEEIVGNVFDLSIKDIEIGCMKFKTYGFLQSKPIEVFDFVSSKTSIEYSGISDSYDIESYLGLSLVDKDGNLQVEEILPLPDSKSFQNEVLFFLPVEAKCKLYPDVMEGACELILNIEASNYMNYSWGFTTYKVVLDECYSPEIDQNGFLVNLLEEGFLVNYDINVIGFIYKKISSNEWMIGVHKTDYDYSNYTIDSFTSAINENPLFVYGREDFFMEVYENETLLIPGVDYLYSLDNGVSWYGDLVDSEYYLSNIKNKKAGSFKIKLIKDKKEKSVYRARYKIEPEQTLSKKNNVFLVNEKIKLNKDLFPNYGYCQNIITVRNIFGNPNEIFLINKYINTIFQNGEKSNESSIKKKFGSKLRGNDL